MNKCDSCVANKQMCKECRDNPIYKDYSRYSYYQDYIPTCPRGYCDCIFDPAYIQCYHPKWYIQLYGNLTPQQASDLDCRIRVEEDPNEEYSCYDDEDK